MSTKENEAKKTRLSEALKKNMKRRKNVRSGSGAQEDFKSLNDKSKN